MKALQLHYTSCRRGQSGNAGFQTRALTPGLLTDEQREIERRGVYRPPRDAAPEPSAEEIGSTFPRALRCYRLESGRQALTRCAYTGRDYSGRWGNFFAHTLLLEDGAAPAFWPVDFYEWPGWSLGLDSAEDTEQVPLPLPAADLDVIAPADSFRLEELREFLREQPGRPKLLAQMGRAVMLGRETARAVVIRDSATNILYWIACVQKLFPAPHAWALSTSSYQDDPRGCADLNGTTGETGFTFDDSERRYRFYMFDLATGLHSEVPEADDDYPAVASRWLVQDPDRLERFFAFMRHFNAARPAPDLVSALHLFELSEDPATPDSERLSGMISFAARFATAQGRAELLEILGSAAENLTKPEDSETLIRFLADGARETGRSAHRELAFRAWLALFRRHVVASGQGFQAAQSAWSHLPRPDPQTAVLLLHDPLLSEASRLSPETLAFLFQIVWGCLEAAAKIPAWSQPEIEGLVRSAASDPQKQALLAAVPRRSEALAAVSRLLAKTWTAATAGRTLARVLTSGEADAQAVRRELVQQGDFEILIGEWMEIRDCTQQPLTAFETYRRSVLISLPELNRQCGPRIRSSLLDVLPDAERAPVALGWLEEQAAERLFPADLASRCVTLANLAVPLDPKAPDGDSIARLVARSAADLGIVPKPDRPLLRDILIAARNPQIGLTGLRLDGVRRALPDLRPEDYELFLGIFLGSALGRAGTLGEHQSVLLATFTAAGAKVFERLYLDFLTLRRKTPWSEELQAALRFWLRFDPGREELRLLAAVEGAARKSLVLLLSRLKTERMEEVRQNLLKSRLDPISSKRWREVEEALDERRQRPWARFVGLFVRD